MIAFLCLGFFFSSSSLSLQCKQLCFFQVSFLSFFFSFWSLSLILQAFLELLMTQGCLILFKRDSWKTKKKLIEALNMWIKLIHWGLHCGVAWALAAELLGLLNCQLLQTGHPIIFYVERSAWCLYFEPREKWGLGSCISTFTKFILTLSSSFFSPSMELLVFLISNLISGWEGGSLQQSCGVEKDLSNSKQTFTLF